MRNKRFNDLPFELIRTPAGQDARYTCSRCQSHASFPAVSSGGRINPQGTLKKAEAGGWALNGLRAECPACVRISTTRAKGESPGPKPEPQKVIPMADASKVREATPQERVKIRAILDKHFDDAAGCWLDGYSDQKAGEECTVPWAIVTRIREAAYGPIRVDPEIAALKAELVHLGREIVALSEKQVAVLKRVDALIAKRAA